MRGVIVLDLSCRIDLAATLSSWVIHQVRSSVLTSGHIFNLSFRGQNVCFDASRRDEYDVVKHFYLPF